MPVTLQYDILENVKNTFILFHVLCYILNMI